MEDFENYERYSLVLLVGSVVEEVAAVKSVNESL